MSHFRREHTPRRRYLPSEIIIKAMHKDFLKKYPDSHCSYNLYREEVAKLNISFKVLGVEECETCLSHKMADHDHLHDQFCKKCNSWNEHVKRAKISRESYEEDSEFDWPSHVSVKSVDLRKVIMLPRIPGVKNIAFSKRIIAFHETFATVGTKYTKPKLSGVWHEALAGRSASEVASCFEAALRLARDITHHFFGLTTVQVKTETGGCYLLGVR